MGASTIQLKDKRNLGYAEYGKLNGVPIFYFHGTPGSRLLPQNEISLAEKLGIRLIVPDRPGYGMSDFQSDRQIIDWPDDVVELADALAIECFGIIGVSGGGPYAVACANKIADRLTKVAMVCSIVPFNAFGDPAQLPTEEELAARTKQFAEQIGENPDEFLQQIETSLSESDRKYWKQYDLKAFFRSTFQEAFRKGFHGYLHENRLLEIRPWGFLLEAITIEVQVWHGENDMPERAYYLGEHIPKSKIHLMSGIGHFIPLHYWDDIYRIFIA